MRKLTQERLDELKASSLAHADLVDLGIKVIDAEAARNRCPQPLLL